MMFDLSIKSIIPLFISSFSQIFISVIKWFIVDYLNSLVQAKIALIDVSLLNHSYYFGLVLINWSSWLFVMIIPEVSLFTYYYFQWLFSTKIFPINVFLQDEPKPFYFLLVIPTIAIIIKNLIL